MVHIKSTLTEQHRIVSYVINMECSLAHSNQYGAVCVAYIKNGDLIIWKHVVRTNYIQLIKRQSVVGHNSSN